MRKPGESYRIIFEKEVTRSSKKDLQQQKEKVKMTLTYYRKNQLTLNFDSLAGKVHMKVGISLKETFLNTRYCTWENGYIINNVKNLDF